MAPDLGRALRVHARLSEPVPSCPAALVAAIMTGKVARLACQRCTGRGLECLCPQPCGAAGCLGALA